MLASRLRVAVVATLSAVVLAATPMNAETRTNNQPGSSVGRLESEKAILYVDNRNFRDQHVYAVTMTGRRISLGIVHAVSAREFEIPPSLFDAGQEFQIKVYPLGIPDRFRYIRPEGSGIKTRPIAVTAGDRIELVLSSNINESTVSFVQR